MIDLLLILVENIILVYKKTIRKTQLLRIVWHINTAKYQSGIQYKYNYQNCKFAYVIQVDNNNQIKPVF